MPSLIFQKQFVPGIRAMLDKNYATRLKIKPKTTTIRATRKRPFKKGDKLFLFSGLRTKQCQRLGTVICLRTEDIEISEFIDEENINAVMFKIDGSALSRDQVQKIATDDGFEKWEGMITWFRKNHGLPFTGQRIHMANTYNRKYFCNKKVKDHGFSLKLETTQKTINVNQEDVEAAKTDRYINELATKHNYGVQIINPLFR